MLLSKRDCLGLASHVLKARIAPAMADGTAAEQVALIASALEELRKREAVLPALRATMAPDAATLLARLATLAPTLPRDPALEHALAAGAIDEDRWDALFVTLDQAAQQLVGSGASGAEQWLRDVAEWELAWYLGFAEAPAPGSIRAKSFHPLDAPKLEAHLARRLAGRETVKVTDFRTISGGFSNETYFFTLTIDGEVPQELVVRKNAPWPFFSHWAHDCAVEFQILSVVADAGLPVPRPLWLFTDLPDVDGSYYIMTRGQGRMAGTLAGASEKLPEELLFSLADFLARLHAIPAENFATIMNAGALPGRPDDTIEQAVARNVAAMRMIWEKGPRLPSPGEAFAFDWLLRNVPANKGRPSLVHTDCFVHNFLVADGEIACVVDWEASHIGDPAEDLAYIRDQVSAHMEWGRFMAHYHACGGSQVNEASLDYYKCLLSLRNYFGSNIGAARIREGYDDLRMIPLSAQFFPLFMKATIEGAGAGAAGENA